MGEKIEGFDVAWPIRSDKSEGRWMLSANTLNQLIEKGYVELGNYDKKRKTWAIKYLNKKTISDIEKGIIAIVGLDEIKNSVKLQYVGNRTQEVRTVWYRSLHNAGTYGSDMLSKILGYTNSFSFPKSIYAVRDTLATVVQDNPKAIIVDFFAGSGTTKIGRAHV